MAYTYFYQAGIRQHILHFLRMFSGFQVEYDVDRDGDTEHDRRTANVVYGGMDRISAAILNKQDAFANVSLPIISGVLTGIEVNPENRHSKFHQENVTRFNSEGNRVTNSKIMGTPYRAMMDLFIYASNTDQMFQLIEQIMVMFNPRLAMQVSDNVLDWNYITEVELLSVNPEQNVPMGTEDRMIIYSLNFNFDFWLDYPALDRTSIIEEIESNLIQGDSPNDPTNVDLETWIVNSNG